MSRGFHKCEQIPRKNVFTVRNSPIYYIEKERERGENCEKTVPKPGSPPSEIPRKISPRRPTTCSGSVPTLNSVIFSGVTTVFSLLFRPILLLLCQPGSKGSLPSFCSSSSSSSKGRAAARSVCVSVCIQLIGGCGGVGRVQPAAAHHFRVKQFYSTSTLLLLLLLPLLHFLSPRFWEEKNERVNAKTGRQTDRQTDRSRHPAREEMFRRGQDTVTQSVNRA